MTNHVFLGLPDMVQSSNLRSRRSHLDDDPWLDWVMRVQSGDQTAPYRTRFRQLKIAIVLTLLG